MISPKPRRRSGTPNPLTEKYKPIYPLWQDKIASLAPHFPGPDRSTGIPKVLRVMKANGSPEPRFESDEERSSFLIRLPVHEGFVEALGPEVTGEVRKLLSAIKGEMTRKDIQAALNLKHEDHFREAYLRPALDEGFIEMTIPDKPRSRLQKYRLTSKGQTWLKERQE